MNYSIGTHAQNSSLAWRMELLRLIGARRDFHKLTLVSWVIRKGEDDRLGGGERLPGNKIPCAQVGAH